MIYQRNQDVDKSCQVRQWKYQVLKRESAFMSTTEYSDVLMLSKVTDLLKGIASQPSSLHIDIYKSGAET